MVTLSLLKILQLLMTTIITLLYIKQDNTVINMTNNEYSNIFMINRHYTETILVYNITVLLLMPYHEAFSISNFTAPCYYQYTAEGQNLDQYPEKLNFSIVFHNDLAVHALKTAHCRWLSEAGSAFNSTKPIDINNRLIKSDFNLAYEKFCYCLNNDTHDCYTDTLTTAYPSQTISLPLVLNYKCTHFTEPIIHTYRYFIQSLFTVEINDNVLPPTACKVAKVNELIHRIYVASCSIINFTIVRNELSYLQWCKLFLKMITTNQIDA